MKQQPMQPIVTDEHGVERFQGNAIVRKTFNRSTKHKLLG